MSACRSFAIVPAAGASRRMGRNKLMLDWQGRPLLYHVLDAWRRSRIAAVVAVVRREETAVHAVCRECCVEMAFPKSPPADMKASVQCGLRYVHALAKPLDHDRWLLAPADLPRLTTELIDRIVTAGESRPEIVLPRFGEQNGHPVSFPWSMHREVFRLEADEGIDRMISRQPTYAIEMPADQRLEDIDTQADYDRLNAAASPRRSQP